ncbi:MAG: 4Fe-4S dicluster domain-containing protein [Gammaproteobacteria bacterium]|nr:4Fe-4S dicluster domain-containing protein [Gammaproteobacteria bacterium]
MNRYGAQPDQARRRFVGRAGATAAMLTLAPGVSLIDLVRAKSDDVPVSADTRWGMLVDATKCAEGCTDCVDACNDEHGLQTSSRPELDAQYIRKLDLRDRTTGKTYSLPMLCQHCETAPCVDVCPTGASFRRADGIVLVDKHTCIGCRYCMMACPYKARSFVHENLTDQVPNTPRGKGTVESCTFCAHRVDRDREPACVEACTRAGHDALTFGDMSDPHSDISVMAKKIATRQIRADLRLNTGVRYHGV